MKKMRSFKLLALIMALFATSCMSDKKLAESMKKVMKENPEILHEAIKADPAEFLMVVQQAAQDAKSVMEEKKKAAEAKAFEDSFSNPLKPVIRKDEAIRGTKGAPLVLVEYSDFECPFCTRGFNVVTQMLEKYKGKIQFIYKHLPLSFHKQAQVASEYYEAIRLQSEEKAFKFHDVIFKEQDKLRNGESFLKAKAKSLGVDMKRLSSDIKLPSIKKRIKDDMDEAQKFGIQGTPGFVLNGIPVKGAYPMSHFENIVSKLVEKKLVSL